ncbi:MAG: ABC transporter ATP-binding protein [Bacteroidetes bacterium]|nr:ABC transporter ATP-binding protein [Bacteroidota bacterium]
MKAVFKFLRYATDHKGLIFLNFIFNLVYIVFQLVTLLMIMPVLKFLFSKDQAPSEIKSGGIDMGSWFTGLYHDFMQWFALMVKGEPVKALMLLCIALVVLTLLKNVARYLAMNFMVLIRNYSVRKMRVNIYEKCLQLPVAYFNEEKKGDLLSRMSNDMKEIEFALMVSLEALYFQPLNIIIFLIALVALSPKLTLYILIFLPVTALVIGLVGRSLRKKSIKNQMLIGKIMSAFEETIGGIRIIKAFNATSFFGKRYRAEDHEYTRNNIGVQRRYDLSSPLSETIAIMVSAALLWLGGNMVFRKELDPEFFLTYFAIFSQLIPPFKGFSSALYASQKGMASLERIQELVSAPVVVQDPERPKTPSFTDSIAFKNVFFSYTENPVIEDVSLEVKRGQTIALVGPSGAGKTTLTDLVARFYDVKKGGIFMDGVDIRDFRQDDLRKLIGIVSQESVLFNDTIRNNIAIGNTNATEQEIMAAAKAAHAHEFILASENGYDTNVGERGSKLSGGQRQRISIARALLKNPEILILDEATSALDSQSEKAVQAALEVLMEHRTSFIIAHRLSTVQHADKIVVMDQGRIAEIGTHEELMGKNGLYAGLIKLQKL